jgi:predicted ATP-grasp superfamily ATP-dependent carboligase
MPEVSVLLGFPREVSGLAVIRSLAKRGIKLKAYDSDARSAGLHSKWVAEKYVWPDPSTDADGFIDALVAAAPADHRPILIDLEGHALDAIVSRLAEVEKHYQLLVPDYETIDIAQDKAKTARYFTQIGLAAPITTVADSLLDLEAWQGDYPAVLKPRRGKGGRGQIKVASLEEAREVWLQLKPSTGMYLMQEWIPGPVSNLVSVGVLADAASKLVGLFSAQRLAVVQTPHIPEGPTAYIRSHYNEKYLQTARQFVARSGWRGPAEFEFKIDERDQSLKILEINPRLWAWVDLPIQCGVDFPYLYTELAQGKAVEAVTAFRSDVYYLRIVLYTYTQIYRLLSRKQGPIKFLKNMLAPFASLFRRDRRLIVEDIRPAREYWYWFRFYMKDTDLS